MATAHPRPGRVHPGVGTGCIVQRHLNSRPGLTEAHLLMVRRAGAHGAGTWSVPGGWIEKWGDPLREAEREVMEEVGVEVEAIDQAGWTDAQHPADDIHAVTLWVVCRWVSGEPVVAEPDKCPEVGWIPSSQVGNRPLFTPFDKWWKQHGPEWFR